MQIKLSHSEAVEICQRYLSEEFDGNIAVEIAVCGGKEMPNTAQKISLAQLDQLWANAVRPLDTAGELMNAKIDLAKLYRALRLTFTNEPLSFMEARNFVVCHRHELGE